MNAVKPAASANALPPLSQSIQYLDREFRERTLVDNPKLLFKMIRVLEISVKAHLTPMILSVGYSPKSLKQICQKLGEFLLEGRVDGQSPVEVGRRAFVAHNEAEWSVLFANDKMMLHDLGFISAGGGDLRKARWLASPEQTLNLLRWKQFRDNPRLLSPVIEAVLKRGGAYGKKFFRRLSEVIAHALCEFPNNVTKHMRSEHRRLQMFFLDNWAVEWAGNADDSSKKKLPPLYTFKNKAMFDLLYELANKARESTQRIPFQAVENMDEESLCMVWRRLGLHRPDTGYWGHVEWERSRRSLQSNCLVIWDRKPGSQF